MECYWSGLELQGTDAGGNGSHGLEPGERPKRKFDEMEMIACGPTLLDAPKLDAVADENEEVRR